MVDDTVCDALCVYANTRQDGHPLGLNAYKRSTSSCDLKLDEVFAL